MLKYGRLSRVGIVRDTLGLRYRFYLARIESSGRPVAEMYSRQEPPSFRFHPMILTIYAPRYGRLAFLTTHDFDVSTREEAAG